MHTCSRAAIGVAGGLLLMLLAGDLVAAASPRLVAIGQAEATTAVDTSDRPNQQPYTTDRSVLYHVLAAPAYVLHGMTRPLGWGVRYVEQNHPGLFDASLPARGVLPVLELGGPTGFLGGLLLYDNQLFGSAHSARLKGLYGGPNTFRARAAYASPSLFGIGSGLQVHVNVLSNPRSGFFLGGNDSDREEDDASANRDQVDVSVALQGSPMGGVRGAFDVLYEHVVTNTASGNRGRRLERANPPGLGTVDLLTSRVTVEKGWTKGGRRPYLGTEAILQLDYTHDLNAERYRYGRYAVEVRQYLPVLILPNTRRLVVQGQIEQVEPLLGGTAVPFYQRPALGGQNTLRGFPSSRFQAGGALAGSAEYRYPIWSNLDALFLIDAGQVFGALGDVAVDRFHWSYGGGIHLLTQSGLGVRFEVAGSTEGVRTILTVDSSFQRGAR